MKLSIHPKYYSVRSWVIFLLFSLIGLIFLYRAYELVFDSPLPDSAVQPPPPVRRGIIFDSRGHELAVSADTASVGLRPLEVVQPEEVTQQLAEILGLSPETVRASLSSGRGFRFLKRKISQSQAEEIQRLKLSGIILNKEPGRKYPNGHLGAALLGFVGIDNEGLAGIEYQYNDILSRDSAGILAGDNVHLSINAFIQHALENKLAEQLADSGGKAAVGIISEVSSGRILAMASLPDFDPNHPEKFPEQARMNRAIAMVYEPGSTYKMFSLASLIENGLFDAERIYVCKGYFEYKGRKVRCTGVHGKETLRDIIKHSCNAGIIEATWEMPILRFYETLRLFGFDSLTEVDLPGEVNGHLPSPGEWDIYLKMTIPIGHGVSVTPLQLVMASNALGNGGNVMRPIIVDKITDAEGNILKKNETEVRWNAVSSDTANIVRDYMRGVVQKGGTGHLAAIDGLDICGKTGTSIKVVNGRYAKGKYQASFLGFYPCKKPEISILIWIDEPTGGAYQGGQVAAPVFREVLKKTLPILRKGREFEPKPLNPLEWRIPIQKGIMPDFRGMSKKQVLFLLQKYFPGKHRLKGSGYVTEQHPAAGGQVKPPFSFDLEFGFDE